MVKADSALHPKLSDYIEYRKSGLSLNHIIGCPLDCAYCIRHIYDGFHLKAPIQLVPDEVAVSTLLRHPFFTSHKTPIQLFNKATDPFLAKVRPHTHRVLQLLDGEDLSNHALVITRCKVTKEDIERLESLKSIHVTLLVTYSGMTKNRIEPFDHNLTRESIETLSNHRTTLKFVLYWRPIVRGWNDDIETIDHVLKCAERADAIVLSGLFYREEQQSHFHTADIAEPYSSTHRRKILPGTLERKVLERHSQVKCPTPIFKKTSCAVAYCHGMADYNGHFAMKDLCKICPKVQVERCQKEYHVPTEEVVDKLLKKESCQTSYEIEAGHMWTEGLGEEKRYRLQHSLGFQVWDREYPHYEGRHGRAPEGY